MFPYSKSYNLFCCNTTMAINVLFSLQSKHFSKCFLSKRQKFTVSSRVPWEAHQSVGGGGQSDG